MGLAKEVGEQQIVLGPVPFVPYPTDAVHQATCR
jgi:hypothetical protein